MVTKFGCFEFKGGEEGVKKKNIFDVVVNFLRLQQEMGNILVYLLRYGDEKRFV